MNEKERLSFYIGESELGYEMTPLGKESN